MYLKPIMNYIYSLYDLTDLHGINFEKKPVTYPQVEMEPSFLILQDSEESADLVLQLLHTISLHPLHEGIYHLIV